MNTLKRCSLIKKLDSEAIDKLLPFFASEEKAAGETVFTEGDEGDGLYVVESGAVRATKVMPRGHKMIVAQFFTGDVFGEMALVTKAPRSADCIMDDGGKVWHLSLDSFDKLKKEEPRVHAAFVRSIGTVVSERLKSMTGEITTLLRELSYTQRDMDDLREQVRRSKSGFAGFLRSLVGGRKRRG